MHVLVLGATGFIGGQIARALIGNGYRVRALRRPTSSPRAIDDLPLELVQGDLRDRESLVRAMQGIDAVFHAAGHYPAHSLALHRSVSRAVVEMRNVLGAARTARVERIVYTSSLSTIGRPAQGRLLGDERDMYVPGSVT